MSLISQIKGDTWFNSTQVDVIDLLNKVLLLYFFNFSSRKSHNTIPFANKVYRLVKRGDFELLGIHSSEFDFEDDRDYLERNIENLDIKWPILLDNDNSIRNKFGLRRNPGIYLFDKKGNKIAEHFDDVYLQKISTRLIEEYGDKNIIDYNDIDHVHTSDCFQATKTLYFGYETGAFEVAGGNFMDSESEFEFPKTLKEDAMFLSGAFYSAPDYVESRSEKCEVMINFKARSVDLIIQDTSGNELKTYFKDDFNDGDCWGDDVSDGVIKYAHEGIYNIIKGENMLNGFLKIKTGKGVRFYKAEFSGCVRH